METKKSTFHVEYQCPTYGVVYYRTVEAVDWADAKFQVREQYPDVVLNAVFLADENEAEAAYN